VNINPSEPGHFEKRPEAAPGTGLTTRAPTRLVCALTAGRFRAIVRESASA
jgi:hypothetical protein